MGNKQSTVQQDVSSMNPQFQAALTSVGSQVATAINPLGGISNIAVGLLDPASAERDQQIAEMKAQAQQQSAQANEQQNMRNYRDYIMSTGGKNPFKDSDFSAAGGVEDPYNPNWRPDDSFLSNIPKSTPAQLASLQKDYNAQKSFINRDPNMGTDNGY